MSIRVVVAEDNFLVRQALVQLVEEDEDLEIAAVCRNADEVRGALAGEDVGVVLTDVGMPPSMTNEGVRLATELRETRPELGVIVLSAYCDPLFALELLEGGSDRRGYLIRDGVHSGRQLTATIKAVARGGSAIDPRVVQALVEARERRAQSPLAALSARERDILVEMAAGASNAAIAEALGLTKRGVEKHINAIFSKLALPAAPDVSRRVRAVLLYLAETTTGGPARSGRQGRPRRGTAVRP